MTRKRRWFLPETPDVLVLLRGQVAVTLRGLYAFEALAGGDSSAATVVREAEEQGSVARRELLVALRAAFVTQLEPEDVFALSRGVDRLLNRARMLINESGAMACPPDARIAEMASLLAGAVRHIDEGIAALGRNAETATEAADAVITCQHRLEQAYYSGMADLLGVAERSERIARRELYRSYSHLGELVVDIAERVIYALMKEI